MRGRIGVNASCTSAHVSIPGGNSMIRPALGATLVALVVAIFICPASAQNADRFPSKPVRVIVPQGPGGATDIQARLFSAKMSEALGQQFVVDNRVGGGAAGVI